MGWFSEKEPESIEVAGQELRCLVCGHDRFNQREAQLNTAAATFFKFDWANATGVCVVCDKCGYIHWFLPR